MKNKSVYADLFIACHAHPLYEFFLIAYRCECRHEPAIAVIALSYIVRGRTFDEELRGFKDILGSCQLPLIWNYGRTYLNTLHR